MTLPRAGYRRRDDRRRPARAWTLGGEQHGELRRASACRGRFFELDVEPGAVLLRIELADGEHVLEHAVVPEGNGEVHVRAGELVPELRLGAAAVHASPLLVLLVASGSQAVAPLELHGRRVSGGLRYPALPAGARLRVSGVVAGEGPRAIERVLEDGAQALDWP